MYISPGYLQICQENEGHTYPDITISPELVASATGYVTSTAISIEIGYIANPNPPNKATERATKTF